MELGDVLQIGAAVIASVGGAGVIIIAVSKRIGDLIANGLMEKYKAEQVKEIEAIKNQYTHDLRSTEQKQPFS